jgi:hypothetical protein
VGDNVSISINGSMEATDFTVVVGCPDQCEVDLPGNALCVIGSGWRAWVGELLSTPCSIVPDKSDPMGPFLAATFAAGEVFKMARGATKGVRIKAQGYSLWSRTTTAEWNELEEGPSIFGRLLPSMHIVGAGAVGHALVYTLVAANMRDSCLIVIDDDIYDSTNLNRCVLAGLGEVGGKKVFALQKYAAYQPLTVIPFTSSVQDYLTASKSRLPDDLARLAQSYQFPIVVSCVDKNVARHSIQGLDPNIIFGASTLGMKSRSNVYDVKARTACLACHNPPENDGEKVRTLESALRAMEKDERKSYLEAQGLGIDAIEHYLESPECGMAGESILREHAVAVREFSVGFVSLSAGVLLACDLFRRLLLSETCTDHQTMTSISFLNAKMGTSALSVDPNCGQHH